MHRLFPHGLLVFLVIVTLNSKAQQYVMIKGQVWDLSGQELVGAHAYNQTRHYGTFTDIDGIFFLVMVPGDSLQVTMVGYKPYKMKVPHRLTADSYKLDVTLLGDTIVLKTAEIKPYPATYAELKKEFIKLRVPEEKILQRIQMPDVNYRSKYANPDGTGGLLLPGPFSLLYNAFSKEGKELKKMNKILTANRLREQLLNMLSRQTLEKQFGFKSDEEIDAMMKRCGITADFLQHTPEYKVIEFIIDCSK